MDRRSLNILLALTALLCWPLLLTRGVVGNYGDIYIYAWPFRHFATETLQTGVLPLWNPYIFSGAPFLASPQSALFYPLSAFFYFLPIRFAFNLFAVGHLFLNALGMFLLLRGLGRSRQASLLGAAAWSCSFFLLSKLAAGHVIHLSGYSWMPAILLLLFASLRSLKEGEGFRQNLAPLLFLSAVCALQFFSGHTQVWLHTCLLSAALFFWQWLKISSGRRSRALACAGAAALFCAALCMVQALPTLVYSYHSTRHQPADIFSPAGTYAIAASYSMRWKSLATLLLPDLFGSPMAGSYRLADSASDYLETNTLYFGLLPLLLSLGGIVLMIRKKRFFLPSLCLIFLALALGEHGPLFPWVWRALQSLRAPARFYCLSLALLVLAAAYFWDAAARRLSGGWRVLLLLAVFADLFLHGRRFVWSEPAEPRMARSGIVAQLQESRLSPGAPAPRIFTADGIGNKNKAMLFHLANVNGYEAVLQKSLLAYFGATQGEGCILTTGVDVREPQKKSFRLLGVDYLLSTREAGNGWRKIHEDPVGRLYAGGAAAPPAAPYFRLRTMPDWRRLLIRLDSERFKEDEEILQVDPSRGWLPGPAGSPESGTEEHLPETLLLLKHYMRVNPNKVRMSWESSAPAEYWLLHREAYYPGWKVYGASGEPTEPFRADGYFQAVRLHQTRIPLERIYWLFRPDDFLAGAVVTAAALILGGVLLLGTLSRISRNMI